MSIFKNYTVLHQGHISNGLPCIVVYISTDNLSDAQELCLSFAEEELYYMWYNKCNNMSEGYLSLIHHLKLSDTGFKVCESNLGE